MNRTKRGIFRAGVVSGLLLSLVAGWTLFEDVFSVAAGDGSKQIPVRLWVADAATGKAISGAKLILVEPEGRPTPIAETLTSAEGKAELILTFGTTSHKGLWIDSWTGTVPRYSLAISAEDYESITKPLVELIGASFDMPREEFTIMLALKRTQSPARDP